MVPKHGAAEKPKMFDKDAEINHELVVKKLREIMAARGKKRTNRKEQIGMLNLKSNIFIIYEVALHIIRTCFFFSVFERVSKCCYINDFRNVTFPDIIFS